MRRTMLALGFGVALFAGHPVASGGDGAAGASLAERWCSGCHVVGAATEARDVAPAFPVIARRMQGDDGWVRAWLAAPHPPMPDLSLTRREIDDIVAYLDSLGR